MSQDTDEDDAEPRDWFAPLCRALDLVLLQAAERRKTDQLMPWDRPPGGRNRRMYCGDRSQRDQEETGEP